MNVHVFNIKALRKINCITVRNNAVFYYRSPTMSSLKENKIKETNILGRIMKKRFKNSIKKLILFKTYSLTKKYFKLFKIMQARDLILKDKIKLQIHAGSFRQKLNKFAKLIIYYFARGIYFRIHALRVIQRIMQKQRISYNKLNVNFNFNTKSIFNN